MLACLGVEGLNAGRQRYVRPLPRKYRLHTRQRTTKLKSTLELLTSEKNQSPIINFLGRVLGNFVTIRHILGIVLHEPFGGNFVSWGPPMCAPLSSTEYLASLSLMVLTQPQPSILPISISSFLLPTVTSH